MFYTLTNNEMVVMGFPQAALRIVILDENNNQVDGQNCWMPDMLPCVRQMVAKNPIKKCTVCGPKDYINNLIPQIKTAVTCEVVAQEM